jgi:peptidoglycan/xylan/chitin deacetylase (PgdA/CDA1 family)
MGEFILSVPILTFHKIDPSFEWGVTRIFPRQFRTVIRYLKEEGFETISIQNLLDPNSPKPPKPVILTFDDCYESLYTQAFPVMEEFNCTGTVFVITGYAGRVNAWDVNLGGIRFNHLSWSQIRELYKAGFEIGSHTVHHPDLTRVPATMLGAELEQSKKTIEDKIGGVVHFLSFPFGRYNQKVIDACRSFGYRNGCGFWLRVKKETFVLERKAYYLFDGLWNLKLKLKNGGLSHIEDWKLRIINFCSYGTSLVKPPKYHIQNLRSDSSYKDN